MAELWFAAAIWLVTHLGISSTPLRGVLVNTIGQGAYLGLYSLVAAGSLGYLIWVYTSVPSFDYLWLPNPDLYWAATNHDAGCIHIAGWRFHGPQSDECRDEYQ
jgi:uncharacterized membrane protein